MHAKKYENKVVCTIVYLNANMVYSIVLYTLYSVNKFDSLHATLIPLKSLYGIHYL